ncbi:MAG: restriction endonuclease [Alphaproteobacteria bacterium]|nr:restriction endonuclease [Alphaproteobacteria bacterium]
MSTEGWSCFAHLPAGLIDPRSAALTLNWLRSRPSYAGFKLSRDEVDAAKYERNMRVQRYALLGIAFVIAFVAGEVLADRLWGWRVFENETARFATVWMGTSGLLIGLFILALASFAVMRYRRAEPRRIAFNSACVEFEQVDAWRAVRCDPTYWSERLDPNGFELEAAELIAGYLKTGQVMLTRGSNDYGVDMLACSPIGRIVAQCKQWKAGKIGAPQVRELAGSKAFFGADLGILISLESPSDESEQCEQFAAKQNLQFWNLRAIVSVAEQLRNAA